MSFRKREFDKQESKLRMDRRPTNARITDPSLPAGKRKEIDNVMKKARASPNDAWNKKLLEVEKRDPNRWRHTGYKKLLENNFLDRSSSESDHHAPHGKSFNLNRRSRSRSRSPCNRRTPPSPTVRRSPPPRSPTFRRRRSPSRSPVFKRRLNKSPEFRRRSPTTDQFVTRVRLPTEMNRRRSPIPQQRPLIHHFSNHQRNSPNGARRARSPPPMMRQKPTMISKPKHAIPSLLNHGRQKARSPSMTSCTDDSCSVCSDHDDRRPVARTRPPSKDRTRPALPRSPMPVKPIISRKKSDVVPSTSVARRPASPEPMKHVGHIAKQRKHEKAPIIYEKEKNILTQGNDSEVPAKLPHGQKKKKKSLKRAQVVDSEGSKKSKKSAKVRTRIKIEGEKPQRRSRSPSSGSDSSSSDESTIPTITATTKLTLSERFGKIAQWSVDKHMENIANMRITKNSGGELKVMIEEGLDDPPRRYNRPEEYTGAGHFPEAELMAQGPHPGFSSGSWDDVRVRFDYYKGRGYLRDLDLQDYVKWESWWYKYQEWLKQERFYEMWENRSQIRRRGRKKVPIQNRLN